MVLAPLLGLELSAWCALVFALGLILIVTAFVEALLGGLAGLTFHIPFVGSPTSAILHRAEQAITNALGKAEQAIDRSAGWAWHAMARQVDWLGREIARHANLLALIAGLLLGVPAFGVIRTLIGDLRRLIHGNAATTAHAHSRLGAIEGRLAHGIGEDVLPRIKTLDREMGRVLTRDIPGIRAGERTLTRELESLRTWVHRHTVEAGTLAFAGAVALALGRLGLGWLRCNSLGKLGRRIGCGGFRILDELLAAVVDVLVIADLCQVTKLLIDLAESREVQATLTGIIDGMDELLLCQGVTRPPALAGYWTDPPPLQAFAVLPAA